jgi:hypothetical protein
MSYTERPAKRYPTNVLPRPGRMEVIQEDIENREES